MNKFLHYIGIFLGLVLAQSAFAQTAEVKFGQNRVQYKDFDFQYYKTDHYTTYFYPGGQEIGRFTAKTIEDITVEYSNFLDIKYKKRIDVIVYNTINELNQTNIGIYNPDQNQGGTAKMPNDKIFVYFNGSHSNLEQQIRYGLAKIYFEKIMAGGSFGRRLTNSVLLNLSDWYKFGFIEYLSKDWSIDEENKLRDGMLAGKYKELNKLTNEEQVFVGHAIWHYVEMNYGKNALPNILYLTRSNRSVEEGFQFVLGKSLDELLEEWYKKNAVKFNIELKNGYSPQKKYEIAYKQRKDIKYYDFKANPTGKKMAYVSNNLGKLKVHILDSETKKCKTVFRFGHKTTTLWTDESTPLLAWTPTGEKLSIIFDKKNKVHLTHINAETYKKEKLTMPKFSKVTSFAYSTDSKNAVISAVQKGQSDIFLYKIASQSVTQITDDYFDDFTPIYIQNEAMEGVLFSSNRENEILKKEKYDSQILPKHTDLYFFDINNENKELYRLTNTPNTNESMPQPFNNTYYSYLGEESGIKNQYIGKLTTVFHHYDKKFVFNNTEYDEIDSVIVTENMVFDSLEYSANLKLINAELIPIYKTIGDNHQLTNFSSNIITQQFLPKNNNTFYQFLEKGFPHIYKYELDTTTPTTFSTFQKTDYILSLTKKDSIAAPKPAPTIESSNMIVFTEADNKQSNNDTLRGEDFQSEFDFITDIFEADSVAHSDLFQQMKVNEQSGYQFQFSKVRPYFVKFMVDKLVLQLNNDLLITRYQPYNPSNPSFTFQPLNALFKVGITDILEDYKLYGGITLPLAGSSAVKITDMGYFLCFENLRKRWDKKLTFFYQGLGNVAVNKVPFTNTDIPNGYLNYRVKTTYLEAEFKYPFNVLSAIKLSAAYRNDNFVYKSENLFSLKLPNYSMNWIYLRGEYIYDNTFKVMDNILNGTRLKVFAEVHKEIPTKQYTLGEATFTLPQVNKYFFTEIGADIRHYQKIYKQMILAVRFSYATSLGNRRMIHYLGGLDNSLLTIKSGVSNANAYINPNTEYAFQTMSSPMRGFSQNSRNGTSVMLLNAELRIPIISMLMRKPSKSSLIKNFMIVGFTDIGTAWEGFSPFSKNNPLFIEEYKNGLSTVRILKYKNPVIIGTGAGLRTSLLGYFIKFDMAWAYDTDAWSKKPTYYISFGYDF